MNTRAMKVVAFFAAVCLVGTSCGDAITDLDGESDVGPGALGVTLNMSGNLPDSDGCMVSVDGGAAQAITAGASMTFPSLETGSHVVWLSDIASHCTVADNNPRVVSVEAGDTTATAFDVTCNATVDAHINADKIAVSMVPGASELIKVRAIDEAGELESWTATSSDESLATVTVFDSSVAVVGVALGETTISLSSPSGVTREIPVRVYDPMELDVGELTLRYVTEFECRWHDGGSDAYIDGSFWHPIEPDSFKALGSFGLRRHGCPDIDGQQWMLLVKADSGSDALAEPLSYQREYDDAGSGAHLNGSFWTPVCPAGYVALGSVAQGGWSSPSLDDVACVREDLTRTGEAVEEVIWNDENSGADDYVGIWRTTISDMAFHDEAWLETGTFAATGTEASCTSTGCYQMPYSHPAMNVLAIDLPLLVDTPLETWVPQLTGYEQPPQTQSPLMAKAMLVPFTALLGGVDFSQGDIQWLLANSPFVRVERQVYNKLMFHTINLTSLVQENALELVSGVSTTNSETFSHTVGISITVESGVEFMGAGGKVSATMSYEFGYESMHSVTSLEEEHITVTIYTQPTKAAACWQQRNMYVVKRHNGTRLDVMAEMEFGMDSYVVDEFPNN